MGSSFNDSMLSSGPSGCVDDVTTGGMLEGSFANTFQSQLTNAAWHGASPTGTPDEGGVEIADVVTDHSQGLRRYDPGHPDADKDGYVTYPTSIR